MIAPGAWLGVLGGGQLARMFAMAAHRLGYRVAAVDPDPECPAAGVVDRYICATLQEPEAWQELATLCAAVTIETENVPGAALRFLGARIRVAPDATALEIAQDRGLEKQFLAAHGVPVAPFRVLATAADLGAPDIDSFFFPGLLKACRFGYDGKSQIAVSSAAQLERAFAQLGGPCVLEQRVALAAELSVIVARSADGSSAVHPVPMNHHAAGILDLSVVPAPLSARLQREAVAQALRIATALDYRGVLCVEYFLDTAGRLLVNEIAPRPHNSGHFTIDACRTSQFEQQVRVLAGLPLGDAGLVHAQGAVVMANLLGEVWTAGDPDWTSVLSHPDARLHLYGKRLPRPGRKMGHITCLADSVEVAQRAAVAIRWRLAHSPDPRSPASRLAAPGNAEPVV
ncbi:MAG: 5-(carboxyamino)imidazole ribonucleotide synthase [Betaproteobacteria bacterium]|jgi:5-(carboxyamino)imidazole ribonucleotide synthase